MGYIHCLIPYRARLNSPVYNPRVKHLLGSRDTPILLLREGIELPPTWLKIGGVAKNVVDEYNNTVACGQASFSEELIQAWDMLPIHHLWLHRTLGDLPIHTHQLRNDVELILPYNVHHAEIISV